MCDNVCKVCKVCTLYIQCVYIVYTLYIVYYTVYSVYILIARNQLFLHISMLFGDTPESHRCHLNVVLIIVFTHVRRQF